MASKKKVATKRQVWNKGLEVGKRDAFTPAQVKRIRGLLADRGIPGLRDLALFSMAVDTMLHGQDLLPLVVGEVQRRNGSIRPVIEVARARGKPPVRCALSKVSAKALAKWIASSGKKRTDYLFPGDALGSRPMSGRQLNRLLKLWVAEAGLDPTDYGVESLRRTKALHILKGTGDLQTVRALLGHATIESTARYLGLTTKADPITVCQAFDIWTVSVQANDVAKRLELARPMMRRGASFDTNQARWQLLEECQYMTTLELTTEDDITSGIDAMDLENRLRDVETNCRNRLHG